MLIPASSAHLHLSHLFSSSSSSCAYSEAEKEGKIDLLTHLSSGIDERAIGACAQLVFAPIDESFADDAFLLPSGFREPPLSATRTLDLSSALDNGGGSTGRAASDALSNTGNSRSVLTIAFQFTFENHLRENVAAMARQYVWSVAASVQQVAMAISLSRLGAQLRPKQHKLLYC
ncbi:Homeobox-leucine zipper protein HOX32 [Platanthera guangdongensis]|uniref:Homeobox-leucine zipper protein HOX32 n=1 Tax=Platanthera guangdongensis TaxID=2320717 RepID=A0ABR2M4G8_9ASPA